MKLLRLKLNTNFRSLKAGFEVKFRGTLETPDLSRLYQFEPLCFAGLNGSGKSNVLEALGNIFYHLELCANRFKPDAFKSFFSPNKNINGPDAFELEYLIDLDGGEQFDQNDGLFKVLIKKQAGSDPEMEVLMFSVERLNIQASKIPLVATSFDQRSSGKSFLPELVVGYSSGENEILSIPFIKSRLIHFDEYAQSSLRGEKFTKPESSLVYIDSEMSQAVLLACLIFEDEDTLKPLRDELGVYGLRSFRMHLANQVMNIGDREGGLHKYAVLNQIEDRIQVLRNLATSFFEEPIKEEVNSLTDQPRYILTLDFYVDETMKEAFKDVFKSSLETFQFFQLLYELNNNSLEPANIAGGIKEEVYKSAGFYTDGKLPKPGPEDMVFFFLDFMIMKKVNGVEEPIELLLREFSDGEHQFLHTMGICLLLKDKRTIMLLDEPETHFNPDWRSKFINVLNKSMEAGGGNNFMKDILLTSHSPFIISDCKRDNVFVFRNGEVFHPKINTFGASIGLVMDEIFLKDDTISDFAKEELLRLRELPTGTLEEIKSVKEASRSVGESAEKVLLFRDLIVKENELKKTQ